MFTNIEKAMKENIQLTGDKEIIISVEDLVESVEEQLVQNDEECVITEITVGINTNRANNYQLSITKEDAIADDIIPEPFYFDVVSPYTCVEVEIRDIYRSLTNEELDEDIVSRLAFQIYNNYDNQDYTDYIRSILEEEGLLSSEG